MSETFSRQSMMTAIVAAGLAALAVWAVTAFQPRDNAPQVLSDMQRAEIKQIVKSALSGRSSAPAQSTAASFSDGQKAQIGEIVKDQLIRNPAVLREALVGLEQFQKQELDRVAVQSIRDNAKQIFRSKYSHVTGNKNGSVTMVEFFDYNCGFCKRSLATVVKLLDTDTDLRLVLKEFPILGPGSVYAARAAIASRKQNKYWEFHLALMGSRGRIDQAKVLRIAGNVGLDIARLKQDMEAPEVAETIAESHALADKMGIRGTPAFVIADKLIPGALGYDALKKQVAEVRKSGGCSIC